MPAGLGRALRATYAGQLSTAPATWSWLLSLTAGARTSAQVNRISLSAAASRMLAAIGPEPAAVISTFPLASQVLGRLRLDGRLRAPAVAVLTDPSVHPLCVANGIDLHLAPGRACAREVPPGVRTVPVAALVDPAFRLARGPFEKAAARRRLGLPADERLAVVVSGSWGVGDVVSMVRDVGASSGLLPVVACGRNERLRRQLSKMGDSIPLGWVSNMPQLLRAGDVVVHNAGGLTCREAMASGVPVISYRCLPGHGTANATVLAAAGLSPWPRTPDELTAELLRTVDGTTTLARRAAVAAEAVSTNAADVIAGLCRRTAMAA
ncbi:glycosyltransferase [Micromonospora sp. 067-2]|uniref:glycosyltransferase n=1 Tax=Micromonospora sp. 067-2 TaxID=2789270 RepID=UPI0039789CAA